MKLVIIFDDSDGCTWSATDTIPIECESEEQLLVDMEEWATHADRFENWRDTGIGPSVILGKSEYGQITITTLEKWFEENKVVQ